MTQFKRIIYALLPLIFTVFHLSFVSASIVGNHVMQLTIDETDRRREKQIAYNTKHNITPTALKKSLNNALTKNSVSSYYYELEALKAAEPESKYLSKPELEKKIREARKLMEQAAKELDFIIAAKLRDEIKSYQSKLLDLKE